MYNVFKVDWFYKCMWSKVNFDLMWNLKMKLNGMNFLNFVVCDLRHGVSNIYLYVEKCEYIYVSVCKLFSRLFKKQWILPMFCPLHS
jgi:hypothetical protein